MASGGSQNGADRSGIDFRVVILYASCVPDVLGLRTRNADAKPVRDLQGMALECVRVLILDANVVDGGFHITLVNMADVVGPTVPVGDLSLLRRQWPVSVVSGMSRKQITLEQLCCACNKRFRGAQIGCCPYCGTNISMTCI